MVSNFPATAEHTTPGLAWVAAMRRGDFPASWAVNDAVLAMRDPETRDDPALPFHQRWVWDGTPPDGTDVLVRCYHGLGDTLQFSRYLPLLAKRARSVTVEVQPALTRLLAQAGSVGSLHPFRPDAPLPPAPCTLEIMEAGHVLRCLPPPVFAPAPRRTGRPVEAGICWTGGDWDPDRWVPPALLGMLADVPGVAWTCLQQGTAGAGRFGPALPPGADVADTAALLRRLHLVVTVDTMVAHLAGSLGVPAWLLLKAEPDWRWLPGGTRSPWYPSVRLYRQPTPDAWAPMLLEVARDLALVQNDAAEELGAGHDSSSAPPVP